MPDQLRRGEHEDVPLDRLPVQLPFRRQREQAERALDDVLVGERGGRVDAVHRGIGPVFQQELIQKGSVQDLVGELAQQVVNDELAVIGIQHDRAALEARQAGREEHVPPLHVYARAAAVGLERLGRRPRLALEQRDQHDALWSGGEQAARYGVSDQSAPAQNHHRPVTQFHGVARWLRSPLRRAAAISPRRGVPDVPVRRPRGAATPP